MDCGLERFSSALAASTITLMTGSVVLYQRCEPSNLAILNGDV
ncbi:hypothetical protein [Nostoc sp.]